MRRWMVLPLVLAVAVACLTARGATLAGAAGADAKPKTSTTPKPAPAQSAAKASSAGKGGAAAKKDATPPEFKAETYAGLKFRSIGPALTSGRIGDLAIHPDYPNTWYVAACSGGLWKTTNAGVSFTPIFDDQGSYSIGCVTIDPGHPLTVWVGTGENNSQRSVSYGDGVYRSLDGGKTWENMGLKNSEHIGRIAVRPDDSNVVYVACQGPLWASGGDRGLYRTSDGGKTWERILNVDEWTGVNEVVLDPRDPDVMYASTYQRARRVWSLINGGPGSGIYKSTDAGKTWRKLKNGLPGVDMGRIGLAVAPSKPDVVYAIVEAADKKGGFFRSTDMGENWTKMSDYMSTSPQYYNELFVDPLDADRVYAVDTWLQVTDDAGKNFRRAGERHKHVDNHVVWIDPRNTDHLIVGCDGGLYESFDRGAMWDFKANLPITQFYKLALDNATPFYNVYGGTQDNNTQGGPTRTLNEHGIRNWDWFITWGGDGFQPRVDPEDPNIVYSELQYGVLGRYDRKNGEAIDIQPQTEPGEPGPRWNWDSPLIISPHLHTRLYFASQRLYRSDDRGDSWTPVSPDLTRQLDRNRMKLMDRVWSVDAVAKNASTSFYGNCVALSESPKQEGLLYVGTDDGLVQVSEDGGKNWRKQERFPGVPELTYVSRLEASQHDANTVYAAFDNHKMGDFKPYVLKSRDRGRTWTSIAGDLPERGTVYCLAEDHVDPNLLFAGTEFGVFFTRDGGTHWGRLKGGLPTIAVRDMAIQQRENDLVLATFGRGFYVLDDYTPLRNVSPKLLAEGGLLPPRDALMYVEQSPLGGRDQAEQGESYYVAPNPPFGATFTYYLKDGLKTHREARLAVEKELEKAGKDIYYPSWDSLRAEDREEDPKIVVTITDAEGNVVRRLMGPTAAGFSRVTWDLTYPAMNPTRLNPPSPDRYEYAPRGVPALPGTYTVAIAKRIDGKETPLGPTQTFTCTPLGVGTLLASNPADVEAFKRKTAQLQRALLGAQRVMAETRSRIDLLRKAIDETPAPDAGLLAQVREIQSRLRDIDIELNGDAEVARRNEPTAPSLSDRLGQIIYGSWTTTTNPTATHRRQYEIVAKEFGPLLERLRQAVLVDLPAVEAKADKAGAPWTPGRFPVWSEQ
jgi:photosystem II stability/assembly factor-like uncharacterized protein